MKIRKNGKVINLTESDLRRIVKRTLREQNYSEIESKINSMEKIDSPEYGSGRLETELVNLKKELKNKKKSKREAKKELKLKTRAIRYDMGTEKLYQKDIAKKEKLERKLNDIEKEIEEISSTSDDEIKSDIHYLNPIIDKLIDVIRMAQVRVSTQKSK